MKTQTAGARKVIRKVVITRSREGNEQLAARLGAIGFEAISIETMTFLPPEDWSQVDASLTRLGDFDWLALTSSIGARSFAERMRELSLDVPWIGKPAVAAVGDKTSETLQEVGISVDFVPSVFLTRALARELPRGRGDKVLLLRSDIADPGAVPALERAGFKVKEHAVYRTRSTAKPGDQRIAEAQVADADAIVFGSPSAVGGFVARLEAGARDSLMTRNVLVVCIGPVTAEAAKEQGFGRIVTPTSHTFDSLLEKLSSAASNEDGA
ncbi:MAG: uroporphyrinogen-III synthase [Thaumarchaeota archaeon]|nr:uroporphyrinogen-III synthase [Nitrososphaerota archaeon]